MQHSKSYTVLKVQYFEALVTKIFLFNSRFVQILKTTRVSNYNLDFMVICFAEKQALNGSKPEPAIRSCDTGHRKPCFDSCHFTTTWPRKFPPRKYNISPSCRVDLKLPSHSPSACTDGRSYADVIIKISRMGRLPHFLGYEATLRVCVELRCYKRFTSHFLIFLQKK